MSNESLIQKWKLGDLKIDISALNNDDKVRYVRIENLINDLIKLNDRIKSLMVQFEEGRFKNEEAKEEVK